MGNSDAHLAGQIGTPHTVVLAEELSTDALLAGIRAGRSWIAESAAIELTLEVSAGDRSAGVGEQLQTGGQPTAIRVGVRGVPSGTVSFHTDRGKVHREPLPRDEPGTVVWHTSAAESASFASRCAIPKGKMAALTNPVILA